MSIKVNGKPVSPTAFALTSVEIDDNLVNFMPKIVINANVAYAYLVSNPIGYKTKIEFVFPNKNEYGLNTLTVLVYDYTTQVGLNGMVTYQILAMPDIPELLAPTDKFNGRQAPSQFVQSVARELNLHYVGAASNQDSVLICCIGDSLKSMINRAVGMMWNDEKSCYTWYIDCWRNLKIINLSEAITSREKWSLVNKTPQNDNELAFAMAMSNIPAGTNNYYAGHGINDYKYNTATGEYDTFHVTKVFKDFNTINIAKEGSLIVRWDNLGLDCGNNPQNYYDHRQQNVRNRSLWSTFHTGKITTLKDFYVGDCVKMAFSPYTQNLEKSNMYGAKYILSRKSTKITPAACTVGVTLMGQGTML